MNFRDLFTVVAVGGLSCNSETLRTRIQKYTSSARPLFGPVGEETKLKMFAQLQSSSCTLFLRWCTIEDADAAHAEDLLLRAVQYKMIVYCNR